MARIPNRKFSRKKYVFSTLKAKKSSKPDEISRFDPKCSKNYYRNTTSTEDFPKKKVKVERSQKFVWEVSHGLRPEAPK
jgi:hypothetical protein